MITIEGVEDKGNSESPLLRIYVLGTLDIQWPGINIPFPKERMLGRGAAPALGLLKAHLTQPDRFALRDWLMEQFWPRSSLSLADERLDDVASGLRGLLRPPGCTAKILHFIYGKDGKGNGYRLEGYPQIWVDADAFEWYVGAAARLDRFGHDSLSLWEQAYQLGSRGEFMPDERYSDWAQPRREQLQGQYRQCVHRVVQLLRQIGAYEEALLRLRSYWQGHKTDEDALRPLLEMLNEREHYQEAQEYYEQAREAVQEERRDLDEKTQDVMEYLRAQPIQRERAIQQVLSVVKQVHPLLLTQEHLPHERSPHLLQSVAQNMMEVSMKEREVQKRTYGLYTSNNSINRQPITDWVQQEQCTHEFVTYAAITGYTHLNADEIAELAERNLLLLDIIQSRRQLLENILNQACATLMLSPEKIILSGGRQPLMTVPVEPAHITRDSLDYLSFITRKHWEMVDNAPFDFLSNMLHHFQTIMRHQKEAYAHPLYRSFCSLAGEHALAIGRTLYDMREYNHSLSYCALSVKIALEIGNDDLRATGFGRMALVLLYSNQLESAHLYLHEAQQIHLQHPWIGAWLSAIEAELYAYAGNWDAFTGAMETSKRILARYPVGDDVYSSLTRFSSSMQLGFEGACLLRLKQPNAAVLVLQQALSSLHPSCLRRRSTILTDIGTAYAQQGDVKKACSYLHQALDITTQTKAIIAFQRIYSAQMALAEWIHDPEVESIKKHITITATAIRGAKHGDAS